MRSRWSTAKSETPIDACVEGTQRLIITLTVVPKLRRHVELVARQLLQGSPDPRLVPVIRGGVDQAIAGVDRCSDDFRRLLVSHLPDAKPELRDRLAVFEDDARNFGA